MIQILVGIIGDNFKKLVGSEFIAIGGPDPDITIVPPPFTGLVWTAGERTDSPKVFACLRLESNCSWVIDPGSASDTSAPRI